MAQANTNTKFNSSLKIYFQMVLLVIGFLNISAISNNLIYSQTTNQLSIPQPDPSCQYYGDYSDSQITEPTFPTDPDTNCPIDICYNEVDMPISCPYPTDPQPDCSGWMSVLPCPYDCTERTYIDPCPYPPDPQPGCTISDNILNPSDISQSFDNYRCPPATCNTYEHSQELCPNPFPIEDPWPPNSSSDNNS